MDISDESLMQRYCAGDYTAFKMLYERHSRGLYRFISWQSPRADWVDEITQDTWMRLHHARANYQPQASFKTLLYQIARNRLIDVLRQKQAALASDLEQGIEDSAAFVGLIDDQIQSDNTPDAAIIQKQRSIELQQAIKKLPLEQKEVLVLQQFSELTLSEIATLTGAKEETVKTRLRYAMQKLRQSLTI